ncbi:MAG: glutamate--tRNA ligase [Clostridiales bacterium]|nr:glutamate--tRNA ligase [Clostridiales bacterium]
MSGIRTRFAPSPTGYMHIGNLRSALYAFLFARKNGGKFVLRIEDTDRDREVAGAVAIIYDTLRAVGLYWDEGPDVGGAFGPYVQSERKALYSLHAGRLIKSGHAYFCFCTKEELDARRDACAARNEAFKYDKHCLRLSRHEIDARMAAGQPFVIRQNIPASGQTTFRDLLFGSITVDNATLDDNVLVKADGMPTYNFANVVDDHLMQISHVMRGMEYLSSTPKYNLLYEALGWEIPRYIHMPPIMKDTTHKLSKRTGDVSFQDFIAQGYLKEAVLNYIALLGWSPGDDREKFTLEELIEAFDIKGMSKSPAIFDGAKLHWLNAAYIRALPENAFTAYARPYYQQAGIAAMDETILAAILRQRVEVFSQIPGMVAFLRQMDENYDSALFTNKKSKTDITTSHTVLEAVLPALESLPKFDRQTLQDCLLGYAEKMGMKNGAVLWPVRIAVSGRMVTPGGAIEILALLGREESLRRLRLGLAKLTV